MNELDPKTQAMLLKIRKGATAAIDHNKLLKVVFPALSGWKLEMIDKNRATLKFSITAPNGKTQLFKRQPSSWSAGSGVPARDKTAMGDWETFRWMKDQGLVADVNAALGMEEHVPASRRSKDGTGTCPVCFRNIKLVERIHSAGLVMVNHGYTQGPNHGYHKGDDCAASRRFRPYELSSEGTEWAAEAMKGTVENLKDRVSTLKDLLAKGGTINVYDKRAPNQIRARKVEEYDVRAAEQDVKVAQDQLNFYIKMVADWKLRDLPKENEPFAAFVKD